MGALSQKSLLSGRIEMNVNGQQNPETFNFEPIARKALNRLLSAKEWGNRIGVAQQKINEWKNGQIPTRRHLQIVQEAKKEILDLKNELENPIDQILLQQSIDEMLLLQYGPQARIAKEKGWND